jgi:hypothetical protein
MLSYSKTAISWVGLKEALLYFPHVVSFTEALDFLCDAIVNGRPASGSEAIEFCKTFDAELRKSNILPAHLRTAAFLEKRERLHLLLSDYMGDRFAKTSTENQRIESIAGIVQIMRAYPVLKDLPAVAFPGLIAVKNQNEQDAEISVVISSLELIDSHKCQWDQLFEFRKDIEVMNKLRRLRLFAYENYAGKSRDFIEDDILSRIKEYDDATKKWGFITATGAINTLINSTLVAGGIAGSFLTAFYQAPLSAIASTIGATGLAIGNMAINLGKQRLELKELMAKNPVSYISYVNEKLARDTTQEPSIL